MRSGRASRAIATACTQGGESEDGEQWLRAFGVMALDHEPTQDELQKWSTVVEADPESMALLVDSVSEAAVVAV